jgi:hypothetical protein
MSSPARSARCGFGRALVLFGALAIVPLAAACGDGDTAGPERNVSVGDLTQEEAFYEGKYLGRTVTVSAAVYEVRGPLSFELSGGDYGDEPVLVLSEQPVSVVAGEVVRVTGTVGQLHESLPSDKLPYVQRGLYPAYDTEAYLFDADVEEVGATG